MAQGEKLGPEQVGKSAAIGELLRLFADMPVDVLWMRFFSISTPHAGQAFWK